MQRDGRLAGMVAIVTGGGPRGPGIGNGRATAILASAEARWITGQLLCVDGGVTLARPARTVGDERA
jgi:hypothetical protein